MDDSPHPGPDAAKVTGLLRAWRDGERSALEELLPVIEGELHRLARRHMSGQRPGHTLQTTALVNEAYLKLVGGRLGWNDRAHFFAAASATMRSILVDHARKRARAKRGGDALHVTLGDPANESTHALDTFLDLDAALSRLDTFDARKARTIELHHFGGLTYDEIACVMDLSTATVHRELRLARAWLQRELVKQ